jgi:hypothetical protein
MISFGESRLRASFEFELDSQTRLLEVLGQQACADLPFYMESNRWNDKHHKVVDWELLSVDVDAVYVAGDALRTEDMSDWDVPSLLVLNPEIVRPLD